MKETDIAYKRAEIVGTDYLHKFAYNNGQVIYDFTNKYQIGHSAYGKLMDAAAKGKHVVAHRLYGHHLIHDIPITTPVNIPAFLEHELSDLFTKQGMPILPGELLKNIGLIKYCDKLTHSWNFINGFGILSAVVGLQQASNDIASSFNEEIAIDTITKFASVFGVSALEFAIAISSANPFLLIAAMLELTAGIRGMMNDSAVIYINHKQDVLQISFSVNYHSVESAVAMYSPENKIQMYYIDE